MAYCTLFNCNYLDRGLVMINSLQAVDADAKIYVLCMDEKCKKILETINIPYVILIDLDDFEDSQLRSIKNTRSSGEYCWTCTSKLIKYIISVFEEHICTYIDADMRFYSNPQVLIDEMLNARCCVQVIPHRFAPNKRGKRREIASGKNCVQFNTFTNDTQSISLLDTWINQCIGECSVENVGDQKYTDSWSEISYVNVSCNAGAGVAPWNITRYKMLDNNIFKLYDRFDKKELNLIFYHFQNLTFPDEKKAFILPFQEHWILDRKLVNIIYKNYLSEILSKRLFLKEKFDFCPITKSYITHEIKRKSTFERVKNFLKEPFYIKAEGIGSKIRTILRKNKIYYSLTNVNEGQVTKI